MFAAKFHIGEYFACHYGTSPMTIGSFVWDCLTYRQTLRAEPCAADTAVGRTICGPVKNLQRTALYVRAAGVSCLGERRQRSDHSTTDYTHTHTHTHTRTHARTHARKYVRTHARTHARTHTHTHTHTSLCSICQSCGMVYSLCVCVCVCVVYIRR